MRLSQNGYRMIDHSAVFCPTTIEAKKMSQTWYVGKFALYNFQWGYLS